MNLQNCLKTNCKIITLIFFFSLVLLFPKLSLAEGEINKIGPFLRKAITETKGDALISLNSTETEEKELVKVIVVMNYDHLSELSEEIIEQLRIHVEQLGGHLGNHAFNNVQAWLPIDKIEALAQWSKIRCIKKPTVPLTNSISSEGLSVIGAPSFHDAGIVGSGVKVGILDLGFSGYSDLLGSELPLHVEAAYTGTTEDFYSTEHGTACAEIVHDVAPGAELFLINSTDSEVDFPIAVSWLRSKGVSIISCSFSLNLKLYAEYTYEALKYDSQYALQQFTVLDDLKNQMNTTLSSAVQTGITWAQSAGNDGQKKWVGPYVDTDFDNQHNFSSLSNKNEIELQSNWTYGEDIYVLLMWGLDNDSIGYDDFDLSITNQFGQIVTSSIINQSTFPLQMEACKITTLPGARYFISIVNWYASPQDIGILVGCDNFPSLEYPTPEGTVKLDPPASNPDAITVGAVPYDNPSIIEPFSSQGPGDDDLVKPDLVAPDGVSTASYGLSEFYGTSAAAPHVAGVCALVKQVYPSWSPAQIKNHLELNATDLGVPGKDNVYGSGLVSLNGLNLTADIDNDSDGYTENQGDCDDSNNTVYPGAAEICGDGIDQDCNGSDLACTPDPDDVDNDGDGITENQGDCNDADASIHPGAIEICGDGIDQDCNGSDLACIEDGDDDGIPDGDDNCPDTSNPDQTDTDDDGIGDACDDDSYLIESNDISCKPRIWDLTGSYTDESSGLDVAFISQDAKGKISGSGYGYEYFDDDVYIDFSYDIKGSIKQKNGVATVKLSLKIYGTLDDPRQGVYDVEFTGKEKVTAVIDPYSQALVGTVQAKLSYKGFGSGTTTDTYTKNLPSGMDGTWSLKIDVDDDGKKLLGNSSLWLSNGTMLPFSAQGKYNAKSDETKFTLKGTGSASGCKLSPVINESTGDVTSITGKVLGQKIKCK